VLVTVATEPPRRTEQRRTGGCRERLDTTRWKKRPLSRDARIRLLNQSNLFHPFYTYFGRYTPHVRGCYTPDAKLSLQIQGVCDLS